jgi:phosphate transport system protein
VTEIRRTYHEDLDEIREDVIRLGALVTDGIAATTEALLTTDLGAADRIVSSDGVVDQLTFSIEERAYLLLARQQPMAADLRFIVAVLRSIHEIERSGDLVVNIAKTARRLYPDELTPRVRGIVARMGTQAATQMRTAMESFAENDAARALALPDMDDVMDDLQRELFRAIFAMGGPDEGGLHRAVQVAFLSRFYERIADHAVNIGQRVAYMVTGELPHSGSDLNEIALG